MQDAGRSVRPTTASLVTPSPQINCEYNKVGISYTTRTFRPYHAVTSCISDTTFQSNAWTSEVALYEIACHNMDTGFSRDSAKRQRLDDSVDTLLHPISTTASNPGSIFDPQHVPQNYILDTVQALDPWTDAQKNNGYPSQNHQELPSHWNGFDVSWSDDALGINPVALYNHGFRTGESALLLESFQCQLRSEEIFLSTPNPPNTNYQVRENGSDVGYNTVICFGMVSILDPTYYEEICMALTL
jgi:hypothetical protein